MACEKLHVNMRAVFCECCCLFGRRERQRSVAQHRATRTRRRRDLSIPATIISGRQPDWRKLRSRIFEIGSLQQQTRSISIAHKVPSAEAEEDIQERKNETKETTTRPKSRTSRLTETNYGNPDMTEAPTRPGNGSVQRVIAGGQSTRPASGRKPDRGA
jgi:hypothetical protein